MWNDCLEFRVFIRFNTAHETSILSMEAPKTTMSGKTSYVNQFYELEWFTWVAENASFLHAVLKLGHYFELSRYPRTSRVYERVESKVLPREVEDIGLESASQYDPYEDETQYKPLFPKLAEEQEPTPEVRYHYT